MLTCVSVADNSVRTAPRGVDSGSTRHSRFASIDGDADRVVFFYMDETRGFRVLDGDKITALITAFIQDCLRVHGSRVSCVDFTLLPSCTECRHGPAAGCSADCVCKRCFHGLLESVTSADVYDATKRVYEQQRFFVFPFRVSRLVSSICITRYSRRLTVCPASQTHGRPRTMTLVCTLRPTVMELSSSVAERSKPYDKPLPLTLQKRLGKVRDLAGNTACSILSLRASSCPPSRALSSRQSSNRGRHQ